MEEVFWASLKKFTDCCIILTRTCIEKIGRKDMKMYIEF